MREEPSLAAADVSQTGKREQQATPALRVYLLQGCRLEWTGRPVAQDIAWYHRSSARALFILLLCAPKRTASRSQLAGILWPETDEERANDSLRSALKYVRDVLRSGQGDDLLEAQAGTLTFKGQEHLWLDLDAITDLMRQARNVPTPHDALPFWEQVRALLCEDLLVEERTSEWSQYRWIKVRRQELRAARRAMIRALSDFYLQSGQQGQAEELLHAHVIRFPTDQDALYRLMKLLIQSESFEEARTYYERCRIALAGFGKEPAEHVKALAQEYRSRPQKMIAVWKSEQRLPQADPREETALSFPSPMTQGMLETTSRSEGNIMDQLRRQLLIQTLQGTGGRKHGLDFSLSPHIFLDSSLLDRLEQAFAFHARVNLSTFDYLQLFALELKKQLVRGAGTDWLGLLTAASNQLRFLINLLESLSRRDQQFITLIGETCLLIGDVLFNMQDYQAATRYYEIALRAAQEAPNMVLQAIVSGRYSLLLIDTHQYRQAQSLMEEALRQAGSSASSVVCSWLWAVKAEVYANEDEEKLCLEALEVAREQLGRHEERMDCYTFVADLVPSVYGDAKLLGYEGTCYLRLKQPEQAQRILVASQKSSSHPHHQSLVNADFALALTQQDAPREACNSVAQALASVQQTGSPRAFQRILSVRQALHRWNSLPEVRELDERIFLLIKGGV